MRCRHLEVIALPNRGRFHILPRLGARLKHIKSLKMVVSQFRRSSRLKAPPSVPARLEKSIYSSPRFLNGGQWMHRLLPQRSS